MYKLIIVDDEKWTRDTIKVFGKWEEYGIEIAGEAENGQAAIDLVKEVNPHIIITDMKMSGLNGAGFLKVLENDYSQLKIIVVSGYDDFEYTKQAIRSKVNDYLLKPVDADELNTALKKCIDDIDRSNEKSTGDNQILKSINGEAGNFSKRKHKKSLYEVKDYIECNYMQNITLENIAGRFFLSKEYLCKAFKEEFNINITDYIIGNRMNKAKDLICKGEGSFKNIAIAVGYNDLFYFYKVFKKYYGISPGIMRTGVMKG